MQKRWSKFKFKLFLVYIGCSLIVFLVFPSFAISHENTWQKMMLWSICCGWSRLFIYLFYSLLVLLGYFSILCETFPSKFTEGCVIFEMSMKFQNPCDRNSYGPNLIGPTTLIGISSSWSWPKKGGKRKFEFSIKLSYLEFYLYCIRFPG